MITNDIEFRTDLLLRVQVALLGMVEPSLRGVTVGWTTQSISVILYFHGELRAEDIEDASDIEAEIIAHFPKHEVLVVARRLDSPRRPAMLQAWAYRRKEVMY